MRTPNEADDRTAATTRGPEGWGHRFLSGSLGLVVVIAAVAVAAAFFRAVAIPKWHTIWAEDGSIFAACAYREPFPACFATPYEGYIHLVPRLAAAVSVLFDPRVLPLALTTCAGIANAAAAAVAGRAIAQATGSRITGLLGGGGLVLVYQAGREVGGNLATGHLVLFASAAAVLLCQWIGRRCDLIDWALIAVTALTSPTSTALPILAVIGVAAGAARSLATFAIATAAAAPQLLVELTSHRNYLGQPVSLTSMMGGFWRFVVREGFYGPSHPFWGELTVALIGAIIAWLAIVTVVRARGPRDPELWRTCWALAATGGMACLAVASWMVAVQLNGLVNPRYAYEPAALLILSLAIGVGSAAVLTLSWAIPRLSARSGLAILLARGLPLVVAIAVGYGFVRTFRIQARSSFGPDAAAAIAAVSLCPQGSEAEIRIAPIERPWFVRIPCERLFP